MARPLPLLAGLDDADLERPRTRGDCVDGERPCPFVGCSYHLYLDVRPSGSLQINFPELEPDQLKETCALDVADRGKETTLDEIGELINVTRERIRQIEAKASAHLRRSVLMRECELGTPVVFSPFVVWVERHRRAPFAAPPDDLFL